MRHSVTMRPAARSKCRHTSYAAPRCGKAAQSLFPTDSVRMQVERAYLSDLARRLHGRLLLLKRATTRARDDRRRMSDGRRRSSRARSSSVAPLPAPLLGRARRPENALAPSGTLLHGLLQLHGADEPSDGGSSQGGSGLANESTLRHVLADDGGTSSRTESPAARLSVREQRNGEALRRLARDKARLVQIAQRFIAIDAGLRRQLSSREGSRNGRQRSALSLQRVGVAISKRFERPKSQGLRVQGARGPCSALASDALVLPGCMALQRVVVCMRSSLSCTPQHDL